MAKEEMKIGEVSKPRFEFRSFGQCFCEAHKRMAPAKTTSTTPRFATAKWTSRLSFNPSMDLSNGIPS